MPPASLFDFQVNGFGGVDFQRDDLTVTQFDHAVATLRHHHTAGIFATFITDDSDALALYLAAQSVKTPLHTTDPAVWGAQVVAEARSRASKH